jgi:hypothetical protein
VVMARAVVARARARARATATAEALKQIKIPYDLGSHRVPRAAAAWVRAALLVAQWPGALAATAASRRRRGHRKVASSSGAGPWHARAPIAA